MKLRLEPVTTAMVFGIVAYMFILFIGEHERQASKLDAALDSCPTTTSEPAR